MSYIIKEINKGFWVYNNSKELINIFKNKKEAKEFIKSKENAGKNSKSCKWLNINRLNKELKEMETYGTNGKFS